MTFSKADLPHIKWSLLTFLLALGASSAIIIASENYTAQAQRNLQQTKHQLGETRSKLATANEDQMNMQTYTAEYESLLKHNVIGNEHRLDWIESMDSIHKQNQAPGSMNFKYSIVPQKTYVPVPPVDSGNFELYRSDMALYFDLLHEEQLMAFLDTLRSDVNGWFVLDRCALERNAAAVEKNDYGIAAQLKAECTGGWVTLRNRSAG